MALAVDLSAIQPVHVYICGAVIITAVLLAVEIPRRNLTRRIKSMEAAERRIMSRETLQDDAYFWVEAVIFECGHATTLRGAKLQTVTCDECRKREVS